MPAATAMTHGKPLATGAETVAYPTRCYRTLAPTHLSAAAAAHGFACASPSAAFRYCELGCGTGLTLAVLAAANPQARFTGIDNQPAHVAAARELAQACGLTNLELIEADINEPAIDIGEFDYIVLHGVYSWVDETTRAALRRFIASRLAPRGLVYLSYNALPGWSGVLPLRDWLQRRVAKLSGSLADRASAARDQLLDLLAAGVPMFTDTPVAAAVARDLRDAEVGYIVHEYLLPGWQALDFDEVHAAMCRTGLHYVGDAELPGRLLPCATHAVCRDAARQGDRLEIEIELDFLHNRFFRRDLYTGATDAGGTDDFDAVALTPLVAPAALGDGHDTPATGLDPLVLAGLRGALGEEVLTYAELRGRAPLCAMPEPAVRATVLALIGAAQLAPCRTYPSPAEPDDGALALANRVLLERFGLLASPVTGGVVAPDTGTAARLRTPAPGQPPQELHRLAGLGALPMCNETVPTRAGEPPS